MEDTHEYRMPETRCPVCLARLDAVTNCVGERRRPCVGDFSICLYCATLLRFTSAEEVTPDTEEDLEMLKGSALEAYTLLTAIRAAILRIREAHKKRAQALLN